MCICVVVISSHLTHMQVQSSSWHLSLPLSYLKGEADPHFSDSFTPTQKYCVTGLKKKKKRKRKEKKRSRRSQAQTVFKSRCCIVHCSFASAAVRVCVCVCVCLCMYVCMVVLVKVKVVVMQSRSAAGCLTALLTRTRERTGRAHMCRHAWRESGVRVYVCVCVCVCVCIRACTRVLGVSVQQLGDEVLMS